MKKFLCVLICPVLIFSLCSCGFSKSNLEKGLDSLVSAIGFSQNGDNFNVYIETVTINSEDPSADKELLLIEGSGKNLAAAMNDACRKTVRPFMFSHTAAAIISNSITAKRMREICRYLYNEDEINLSLRYICTDNVEKLLSCDTVASVAVGYDIVDSLERQKGYSGIELKNRFYEVEKARKNAVNILALPKYTVNGKAYEYSGAVIFKNDAPVLELDLEQALIYALATNNLKQGTTLIDNKEYKLEAVKIKQNFSLDKKLEINLNINASLTGDGKPKSKIAAVISELFIESKLKGADIFMFGNMLHRKYPEIWSEIEHSYYDIYKNSHLAVSVK